MNDLSLEEAVNHAKLVPELRCKICERKFQDLLSKVFIIRQNHYCPICVRAGLGCNKRDILNVEN